MTEYTQTSMFDPIQIPLTRGYVAIVDPIDSDLANFKWFAMRSGYAARTLKTVKGKRTAPDMYMAVVILERKIGRSLLPGEECDHIDVDPCNNRRDNLRVATRSQNAANRKIQSNNTSGYKGVISDPNVPGKFRATVKHMNKTYVMGYFDTPEEAYAAYCEGSKRLHGEFARFD